jgi:hypothetical protein
LYTTADYVLEIRSKGILWSLAGSSPQRPGCSTRAVHVAFVVNKITMMQVVLIVLQYSLDNYRSTNTPFSHPSSEAGKMSPLTTCVPRESPHRKYKESGIFKSEV